ncbi:PREDICTED: probable ergosterol biosynthetic protein 28 [Priapulus caudatus]|uniref:Probable ergosterol biosynthetic protein 28 n=1 Tax=Priapulus caudatus TaxID=37621 RepID=A0ABM1EVW2_PRICU|nr:PREDICTED: probable ergosterol biosynthetic protein 28 [Priapulus caudatus]XP_014676334.1 PREDICTED: probable ergosterol biosynthetic protein 28 [Priapulus caudatus]XP_014676335.1 PREDICTED: probable ergosterol biosynthetic protein 28 [Priapulus caudatus]
MVFIQKFTASLRGWIGVVALMGIGNTIQCFYNHVFLGENLYMEGPSQVTPLMARLFGTWTFLAAIVRIYCAYDITNRPLYDITLISFLIAFVHFTLEAFYYQSTGLHVGLATPLLVSGISIVWMIIGYSLVWPKDDDDDDRVTVQSRRKKLMKAH